ncbi:hypothetical protein BT67DRAFT_296894 [Trichocladium antarcticum]|uniref:Uncharacterized protein n=1 Tax=Trichocladium antarcticum TaxID=1450529 RepID=A0AAN6UL01_9PEZI|nr:hypothetical protein BT67DRAFT_296894 [Trichocladium antarcticum]
MLPCFDFRRPGGWAACWLEKSSDQQLQLLTIDIFKPSLLTVLHLHACDDSRSSQALDPPLFVVVRHATARITTPIPLPARWPSAGRWFDDESARRQSGKRNFPQAPRRTSGTLPGGSQDLSWQTRRQRPGTYPTQKFCSKKSKPKAQDAANRLGSKCLFASGGCLEIIRNHRAPGSVGHNVRDSAHGPGTSARVFGSCRLTRRVGRKSVIPETMETQNGPASPG